MLTLYGIKNCDTVRKARKWMDAKSIDYRFHDFRSDGLKPVLLEQLEQALGWEKMINRRSTTWKQLSDQDRLGIDREKAIGLMLEYPTLIKRPVLDTGCEVILGFSATVYDAKL